MTVQIEPRPQALTANEREVLRRLDDGQTVAEIAKALHVPFAEVIVTVGTARSKEAVSRGLPREVKEESMAALKAWLKGAKG